MKKKETGNQVGGKGERVFEKEKISFGKQEGAVGILEEPLMPYINLNKAGSIALASFIMLTHATHKPESHLTAFEKMEIVRDGITKKDLETFKQKALLDYDKLAKALSVTRATLINKDKNQKFGISVSEKIVGLADIYSYGYEVFESEEKFNKWMFRPNQALGGKVPYDLMDNQFGMEEVRNVIGRIDYGVYS